MTATNTAAPAATEFGCAILARDLCDNVHDVNRDNWTGGKMYHVVKALQGATVAITTDKSTGHTVINARLLSVRPSGGGYDARVVYATTLSDGSEQRTAARVSDIGTILVLDQAGTRSGKWAAKESYRNHQSAAILLAQAKYGDTHAFGQWRATVINGGAVDVSYEPYPNPAFADKAGTRGYWRINVEG